MEVVLLVGKRQCTVYLKYNGNMEEQEIIYSQLPLHSESKNKAIQILMDVVEHEWFERCIQLAEHYRRMYCLEGRCMVAFGHYSKEFLDYVEQRDK